MAGDARRRVLFLSRFVEISPTWLADFWQVLQQEMSWAVLLLAGKALHAGGERPYLDSLAAVRSSGRGSSVAWRGYINPADLGEIYASVDCAVFPSEGSDLLKAKCSARMATALQHGVPVVASDVGEQAAYGAGNAARLLPPSATPAQFAHAVVGVLKSQACRQSLGQAAAARMDAEYKWSKLALRLERLYWQVLSNE